MITVNVSGSTHSGKSTIACIIANALLANGFKTSVKFSNCESMLCVSESLFEKVVSIREKETISIVETNIYSESLRSMNK
jgi:cytidylate kinase